MPSSARVRLRFRRRLYTALLAQRKVLEGELASVAAEEEGEESSGVSLLTANTAAPSRVMSPTRVATFPSWSRQLSQVATI